MTYWLPSKCCWVFFAILLRQFIWWLFVILPHCIYATQFLKFVEKTAPIAVYTSGKGSSAAGLTASVVRDSSSVSCYSSFYQFNFHITSSFPGDQDIGRYHNIAMFSSVVFCELGPWRPGSGFNIPLLLRGSCAFCFLFCTIFKFFLDHLLISYEVSAMISDLVSHSQSWLKPFVYMKPCSGSSIWREVQWFLLMEGLFALMSLTRCGQKTGWNFLSN